MLDITIVGGGIVGIATALRLKEVSPNLKVAVLEKEKGIGQHQTGHNSGVIHSGLYYKPGSLKAKNCIEGYNQLIDFCEKEDIPFELCGKLVVATNDQEKKQLNILYERGIQNGLEKIKKISGEEIKNYEPHCFGVEAIHVPYTGIIDYKEVIKGYAKVFQESYQGEIHLGNYVEKTVNRSSYLEIVTNKKTFKTKLLVNCAGLYSDRVARVSGNKIDIRIIPFRGEYYKLKEDRKGLVKNLIYPVPDPNFPFLGVHFTRMINGEVEAGPNAVFAFKKEGYRKTDFSFNEFFNSITWPGFQKVIFKYWQTGMGELYRSISKSAFTKALQKLIPEITSSDLESAEAGVRAQACDKRGGLLDDFKIVEDKFGIHVCNAPSPAATSSLSIGKTVADMALKRIL